MTAKAKVSFHGSSDLDDLRVSVDDLELDPENEREHPTRNLEAIKASLERFGQQKPIVYHKRRGKRIVIAGNGLLEAARSLGWLEVAAVEFRGKIDEARGYRVADNRTAELATWHDENLADTLRYFAEVDDELFASTGFDDGDLEALLSRLDTGDQGTGGGKTDADLDKLPDKVEAKTKPGERIEIGRHVIACVDCVEALEQLDENSIDAVVTDPPYGLGFMGRAWDCDTPGERWARALFRACKPGAHVVAFGATRTVHRLAVALEDSGFEIRDQVGWVQWQGMPKSVDLGQGRGTGLKPSHEPATLARKPLDGTLAENLKQWGTGAINVDACRLPDGDPAWLGPVGGWNVPNPARAPQYVKRAEGETGVGRDGTRSTLHERGRWPANLYYCPKASSAEREEGLGELTPSTRETVTGRKTGSKGIQNPRAGIRRRGDIRNIHPTVKPVGLMRWLVRLVTPVGARVLDPFVGSGTTLLAAELEGVACVAFEREPFYVDIARARLEAVTCEEDL